MRMGVDTDSSGTNNPESGEFYTFYFSLKRLAKWTVICGSINEVEMNAQRCKGKNKTC